MKNKQTIEKDRIENAKHELAFRKRHHAYRTSFEKLKRNFQTEDGLLSGNCEDILFHEMSFSIWAAPELSFAADEGTLLEALDPDKEIDGKQHAWLLFFMFYSPGLHEIRAPHLDPSYNYHKTKERPENILVDELKDHQRLLRIDLRKPKTALIREFTEFITNIHIDSRIAKMPKAQADKHRAMLFPIESLRTSLSCIRRQLESFKAWEPDVRRSSKKDGNFSKKAEMQIKVWDLYGTELPAQKETPHLRGFSNSDRKKRKRGFKHIAWELKITVDAARQAYRKAFERIYHEPYNLEAMHRVLSEIRQSENDRPSPCENCPNFSTCSDPCPKVIALRDQDRVPQTEPCISEIKTPKDCEDPAEWLNKKNR